MKPNDKVKVKKVGKKHTVEVTDVTFEDNGEYVVLASNPGGKSKFKATLIVKGLFEYRKVNKTTFKKSI